MVWAVSNIAGDSTESRDELLGLNVVPPMLRLLEREDRELLQNVAWALSNLCRGTPAVALEAVAPILPHFARLMTSDDPEARSFPLLAHRVAAALRSRSPLEESAGKYC